MDPAYEIRGTRYPIVAKFRHGDPALVCAITGLEWREFIDLLVAGTDDDETPLDIRVQTAMIAVAVAHVHRNWSRDKVVTFVSQLELEEVGLEGADLEEDPTPPPAANGSASNSSTSPTPALESPDARSSQRPTSSGSRGSDTSSLDSLPVA